MLCNLKMRIYFSNDNNLQILNDYFKTLYTISIDKFEEGLKLYKQNYEQQNEQNEKNYQLVLINELKETLEIFKDHEFETYFLKLGSETIEKIRYASISNHSDKCIIRAIFDILFKYIIDFEFKIAGLCCDNKSFKILQIQILRDLQWKIDHK